MVADATQWTGAQQESPAVGRETVTMTGTNARVFFGLFVLYFITASRSALETEVLQAEWGKLRHGVFVVPASFVGPTGTTDGSRSAADEILTCIISSYSAFLCIFAVEWVRLALASEGFAGMRCQAVVGYSACAMGLVEPQAVFRKRHDSHSASGSSI